MTTTCKECGTELQIGDFPYCPHGSIFEVNARRFDPIRIYKMPDGTIYYPGRNDGSDAPAGGTPIDITSLRMADRVVKEENEKLDADLHLRIEAQRIQRDSVMKRNRERLYSELDKRGISRKTADEIIKDRDRRRAENAGKVQRSNFSIECFSMDSSNREGYRDASTGWREKRA